MLQQLSIYAENKKGTMQNITEVLADENINIWGSCTNDGAEYGINRMVVSDPQRAMEALEAVGYLCKLTSVIGVEVEGWQPEQALKGPGREQHQHQLHLPVLQPRLRQAGPGVPDRGHGRSRSLSEE